MAYSYSIAPDERLARIQLSGTVDGNEIITAWHQVVSDPAWESGFSSLWDASETSRLLLLPGDIDAFAASAEKATTLRGPGHTAVVATDISVHINAFLLCLRSKGGDEREFRVFERVGDAEAWIIASRSTADDKAPGDGPAGSAAEAPSAQWEKRGGHLVRVAALAPTTNSEAK